MSTAISPQEFKKQRQQVRQRDGEVIDRLVAAVMLEMGVAVDSKLAASVSPLTMTEATWEAMVLDDFDGRHNSHEAHLWASGSSGANIATELADDVARKMVYDAFDAQTSGLRSLCVAGDAKTLSKDYRAIVEPMDAPKEHPRGGEASRAEIRIERFENVAVGVYTQFLWLDEMDEVDYSYAVFPAIARNAGQSIGALDSDLIVAAFLGATTMQDGDPLCDLSHNNLETAKSLTVGNVGQAYADMRLQLADEKQVINRDVVPNVLVTGSSSYFTALQIQETLSEKPLRIVEDPRLETGVKSHNTSDNLIAGTAAGTWWLLDSRRTIERTTLHGSKGPSVVQIRRQGEFGEWGIGWAVRHMVAITPLDRTCIRQYEPA